jgi:eukaryotic-like serine/threonine-protein kinase
MTPERWQQIRAVLYAASQLEGGARLRHLDESCGADLELRDEVGRLLAALDESGTFLEPASQQSLGGPQLRIGPYIVLDRAGCGGMGVVYHAVRDNDYRQEVAIKVVRAGAETDFLIARFHLERQALALLNHPNIARLLDGGATPDGWPYLVMEWVEGKPITEYCSQNGLGVRERLKLFLDTADAVEHAHRNLVVHRDLKPSNILITSEGIPKLLDFGIAKIFSAECNDDPGSLTAGTRLLTPEYASPEQLRGEVVTTATDVYSLGAVLYEILTGIRPLKLEGQLCAREPLAPSAVSRPGGVSARELRGDLDNIVLKAMQEDPERRYRSVSQFAEDLRRYLQGMPVIARKVTFSYRIGKFVRRNRVTVMAGALVLAAIAAGAATTLWQARVAVAQRAKAERRFNDVRKLAHSVLFEFDDAIKSLPGSTSARSLVVKRALEYLDDLASEAREDRSLQLEIASAYQRVGEVQGDPQFPNLGDSQGALASSRKSLAIRETLSRVDPGNRELRLALASIHGQISEIMGVSGDSKGALEHSGKALALYEALAGNMGNDAGFQSDFATQTYNHANRLRLAGDNDGAVAAYRRAVDLSGRILAAHPFEAQGKIHLATSLDGLGGVLQEKGETAGALESRRQGLAIRQELAESDPNNAHYRRQLGFSHHNVGLSLMVAGDSRGALVHFRRELELFDSLSAADPKDAQARRNRSLAYKQIGDALVRNADPNGALEEYRRSLEIDRGLSSTDPGNAQALLDLSFSEGKAGSALAALGRTREALVLLRSGVKRQELLLKHDPTRGLLYGYLANSYTRVADCLRKSGDGTAVDYYRKAVTARLVLSEKNPASNANRGALAECYTNLGKALRLSDPADALQQYRNAVELLNHLAASNVNDAQNRTRLADALADSARLHTRIASQPGATDSVRLQQWATARDLYQRSFDIWTELDREGRLAAADRQAPRQLARELAGCTNSLAKLKRND